MPHNSPDIGAREGLLRQHRLSLLIPVYNGAKTIGDLVDEAVRTLQPLVNLHEIILVNDGSVDGSHDVLLKIRANYPELIKYVELYRNFGEHNAVMCGLHHVTGSSVAIIDDDFQNPPAEIVRLLLKLLEGYDVVYSYYEKKRHSWFRNLGSGLNDRIASLLLDKPKGLYLSSFKIIDAGLIPSLISYQGPYPYLDGLILRSTQNIGRQLCQHSERAEGESNYTLVKLIRLSSNMFTGFSIIPLRITSFLGLLVSFVALLLTLFFVYVRLAGPIFIQQSIPPGWASTIVTITFLSGLQLIMLGMIGEYLGRVFMTMNRTPQFLIRAVYDEEEIDQ